MFQSGLVIGTRASAKAEVMVRDLSNGSKNWPPIQRLAGGRVWRPLRSALAASDSLRQPTPSARPTSPAGSLNGTPVNLASADSSLLLPLIRSIPNRLASDAGLRPDRAKGSSAGWRTRPPLVSKPENTFEKAPPATALPPASKPPAMANGRFGADMALVFWCARVY